MIDAIINNWASILFYIVVFAVSAGLVYFGNKYTSTRHYLSRLTIAVGLVLPIILSGIRYYVGKDYANYVGMVERIQVSEAMWPRQIEPLSSLVINISASLGGSVTMFFLFAAVTVVFAYLAINKMTPGGAIYKALGWFAYLCVLLPTTLNATRSGAAVSVVAFAFSCLIDTNTKHRLVKFLIWIIVASLFHMSALIVLPIGLAVYAISRKGSINIKLERILLALSVLGALLFPLLGSIFAAVPIELVSNFARYFMEAGEHFYLPIVGLTMLVILIATFMLNRRKLSEDTKFRLLYSIGVYYLPVIVIIGWLSYYTGTSRLAFYLDIIILMILVYTLSHLREHTIKGVKVIKLATIVFILICTTLLVRNLVWAQALPYQTVFSQEASSVQED